MIKFVLNSKLILMIFLLSASCSFAQISSVKNATLFDGQSLGGWKTVNPADRNLWYVADSAITGSNKGKKIVSNTYLQTDKEYGDFELRCLFRLSGDQSTGLINSGIQYRSKVENGNMVGYQADIGRGYWGDIYDEHRRGKLVSGDTSVLRRLLREDGWNSYIVRVKGNHHELYINGVKTCDYFETDPTIPSKGVIAFQLHDGGVAKVEFRDIFITELQ